MVGVLALPYLNPRLRAFRICEPSATNEVIAPEEAEPRDAKVGNSTSELLKGEQALPPSENLATPNNALTTSKRDYPEIDPAVGATLRAVPIENPDGHALDVFFERLLRTERGDVGAVTRILHYGDSIIASDYISGSVRRRLQTRFGDAGHGFILIANPWEWYFHNDVDHGSEGEWAASRLAGPFAPDGRYGLGGVSFTSYGGGASWFGTARRGDFGRNVGRFDLFYLEQPGGGNLELTLSGHAPERLTTRGSEKVSRVHSVRVDDGEAKLTVRATGGGPVRLFGVALERERAGVVYDALGSHAAMAVYWQRQDREHWREQMALRDPALVVLQYGTNESDLWRLDRQEYERNLAALVDELHEVAGASILVVAPLDRAEARGGRLATKRVIFDLVAIQRRVSLSHGAAFWSAFDAMGGEGSMARWVRAKPQLGGGDLTHPTPLGADELGAMLAEALIGAFEGWEHGGR